MESEIFSQDIAKAKIFKLTIKTYSLIKMKFSNYSAFFLKSDQLWKRKSAAQRSSVLFLGQCAIIFTLSSWITEISENHFTFFIFMLCGYICRTFRNSFISFHQNLIFFCHNFLLIINTKKCAHDVNIQRTGDLYSSFLKGPYKKKEFKQ